MSARVYHAADLFCGAGGTSTGLALAAERMGLNLKLTAVNHWDRAVETHSNNHPWANHLCATLDDLKPSKVVPSGRLDLLVASPECTHHSVARGGKPMDDQSRASAWHVLHWCQELYVKNVLIENVPEFTDWGPIGANGRPMKSKRGHTFQAFVTALKSLGYAVDYRVVTCADYGDATTRRRFFLMAQRGNRRPVWPDQTHFQTSGSDMFGENRAPWVPARDIIDWSIPGHSIFLRPEDVRAAGLGIKRPLADNTLKRIEAGIRKFWGDWAEPFLVHMRGTSDNHVGASAMSLDLPVPTLTANRHVGLCRPMIRPFIMNRDQRGTNRDLGQPIPTVTGHGSHMLVSPFVMATGHGGRTRGIDNPLSTVVTKAEHCLVEPFLVKYYGTGTAVTIDRPLDTVRTDDSFGLVRPMITEIAGQQYMLDILFRMLTPAELAAAHSFPMGYRFAGTKTEIVRQIGNSVPVRTAMNLCQSRLAA